MGDGWTRKTRTVGTTENKRNKLFQGNTRSGSRDPELIEIKVVSQMSDIE